jgi:hypothetical protein
MEHHSCNTFAVADSVMTGYSRLREYDVPPGKASSHRSGANQRGRTPAVADTSEVPASAGHASGRGAPSVNAKNARAAAEAMPARLILDTL